MRRTKSEDKQKRHRGTRQVGRRTVFAVVLDQPGYRVLEFLAREHSTTKAAVIRKLLHDAMDTLAASGEWPPPGAA